MSVSHKYKTFDQLMDEVKIDFRSYNLEGHIFWRVPCTQSPDLESCFSLVGDRSGLQDCLLEVSSDGGWTVAFFVQSCS